MFNTLKLELNEYYRKRDIKDGLVLSDKNASDECNRKRSIIFAEMDEFYKQNPQTPAALLKSRVHTLMAKYCEPVIFKGNPFFFETGYNHSLSWGLGLNTPASWFAVRKDAEIKRESPAYDEITNHFSLLFDKEKLNLCNISSCFDIDHHTLGFTKLFSVGIGGIKKQAKAEREKLSQKNEKYDFCTAVIESCDALIEIAHKFSKKAGELLMQCTDEAEGKYLRMIADAALKIPEKPPETFYEGLAMLIFTREVISDMERMGLSHLGHVDKLLWHLYENDLRCGRINEKEAEELIAIWMVYTDIKFNVDNREHPETSTCIQLGGCDEKGNAVFNDLTKMFIKLHCENNLINPKLNCRISENSPDEYLKYISGYAKKGHNNFAFINDAVVIDGLVKNGVELSDARRFVNGGCQETMIEGCGHTEGAGIYVSVLRLLDLFLRKDKYSEFFPVCKNADTYEEFYESFIKIVDCFFKTVLEQRNKRQSYFKKEICCPLYSATQEGCIETGKDYVTGGAKYNFSTVALVGLANLADSLYVLKTLVFEQKKLTLDEFNKILDKNWAGNEAFRAEVIALPKYGHDNADVDKLANGVVRDFSSIIGGITNERGGKYITSFFVYNNNRLFAPCLRATPDGRYDFDYTAAGSAPSTIKTISDISAPVRSMKNIDFTVCGGGITVLDMMMPVNDRFDENAMAAVIRSFCQFGGVTMQPNFVSKEDLIDAKTNPGKYKNLTVRLYGLSVRFVNLTEELQNEVINRNYYTG